MLVKNKVVLVTGASRGIGRAISRKMGSEGALVILNYLSSREAAESAAKEIRESGGQAAAMQADVTDEEQVKRMMNDIIESYGGIDAVINNALSHYSFNPKKRKAAWELEWDDYNRQWEGSIRGAYNVCRAAIPYMKEQMSGNIVNIASNLVKFPVIPYHDYTTAKSGLLGFTRNLAKELGCFGITVNAVAPGLTYPTDSSAGTKEDVRNSIIELTPMQRLAAPEDIADAALYFASPLSSFVTGQCLYVDGGLVMGG
ncbi:3-oxoacyl-ACP reductase [Bacillus sp. MMSF_3328]|uniref:3-oxoacyl-ACP reductase n=1 Tax=Bacillus sp. MMSF_3328 TaxID=3047080 RepID=UPI0027401186|nr:3-oxoacyl-ACP reductase [Bacillus sp. MMSF_3328]